MVFMREAVLEYTAQRIISQEISEFRLEPGRDHSKR
jgi:hypothetical protein